MGETGVLVQETILVASADAAERAAVAEVLRGFGHSTGEVATGGELLARLGRESLEVVVLGSDLAGFSPAELCRTIKERSAAAVVPVVDLAAPSADAVVEAALECGADAVVPAPVDPHLLLATVRMLLRTRQGERDRQRLVSELDAQRRFLVAIVDNAPEGIMVADEKARVVIANQVARDLLGRPIPDDDDIESHAQMRMVHPDGTSVPPRELPLVRAALEGESFGGEEMATVLPDGEWRHMLGNAAPIRDAEGTLLGAVVIFQDITGRKRAEQEMQRLLEVEREQARGAQLLAAIQESVTATIGYLDRDLRIVLVNRAAERALGRAREDLIGHRVEELFPESAASFPLLREVLASGEPVEFGEFRHIVPGRPELGLKYYNLGLCPVRDEKGEVDGVVLTAVDITEQVEQREKLVAAERARAQLAETMNSEISHRVKNNLMMVTGLLQMQTAGQRDPNVVSALRDTLTRLLAFASIHDQLQATGTEEVDLVDVMRRIAEVNRRVFADRNVQVSVSGTEVCLSPRAVANVSVVVNELITNAVKHGAPAEDGALYVEVHIRQETGKLRVTVWNSGDTLPAGFDISRQMSMGLRMVHDVVVSQGSGSFVLVPDRGGTRAEMLVDEAMLK